MAVYFITGKLGGGKTLAAVSKAKDYLLAGRPVATNLDLDLRYLVGPRSNRFYVRLPDSPSYSDLLSIGKGNKSTDESRNGALILDECATWFNSRGWADKSRQEVINWLVHARKLGWDVFFIVQSVQVVDKQARLMLAEHVVYCRRMDRISIPLISTILSIADSRVTLPRFHLGIVKYGDQPGSLVVDRWWYRGDNLFKAYDTRQAFSQFYPHGPHSVLPPLKTVRNYATRNGDFYMRLSRILWRRYSRPLLAIVGLLAGLLLGAGAYHSGLVDAQKSKTITSSSSPVAPLPSAVSRTVSKKTSAPRIAVDGQKIDSAGSKSPLPFDPATAYVSGSASGAGGNVLFVQLADANGHDFTPQHLRSLGYAVVVQNACEVDLLAGPGVDKPLALFSRYCAPLARPKRIPRMSSDDARAYRFREMQAEKHGLVWLADHPEKK